MSSDRLLAPECSTSHYRVTDIPATVKLCCAAHHRYCKKWMKRLGITPNVIKMDTEDHAFEALSGAVDTLSNSKPFIVVESWLTLSQPLSTLSALQLLEAHGNGFYQPCWRVDMSDGGIVFPDLDGRVPDYQLALIPFLSEQRFMLSQLMNVFACPKGRKDDLKALGFVGLMTGG